VVTTLFARLAPGDHALVAFDINRDIEVEPLFSPATSRGCATIRSFRMSKHGSTRFCPHASDPTARRATGQDDV
jgi:hypothetical protein